MSPEAEASREEIGKLYDWLVQNKKDQTESSTSYVERPDIKSRERKNIKGDRLAVFTIDGEPLNVLTNLTNKERKTARVSCSKNLARQLKRAKVINFSEPKK
jgi:hypothetical protein